MKQYSVTRRPSALAEFAYHTIAAIVLLLFVSIRLKQAIWSLEPRVAALALLAAGGYWLAATSLLLIARRGRSVSAAQAAAICLAAATVVLIAGSAAGSGLPRIVTLEAPLLGLALLLLGQVLRARLSWTTVTATAALAVVGLAAIQPAQDWLRAARRKPSSSQTQIRSSLYDLNISAFRHYTPRTSQSHGGLALFGDRYLLADGGGNLFVFQPSADLKKLDIKALAYRVPINSADFSAAAGTVVHAHLFRVAGVISQEIDGRLSIFASHHYWNAAEHCWVMRVSSLQGRQQEFLSTKPMLAWETVFESSPCVPLAQPGERPRFSGMENGGRLAWLSNNQLLVTIGDHAMDGWAINVRAAQEETWSYGKIMQINLDDHSNEIFSLGHRNPQGLTVTSAGQIWSTEHGPEGGDELNLIQHGGNYGWPLVSYGTDYGSHAWPLAAKPGSHDGFIQPYYSWVPSIGVSSLLEITSPRFEYWRGDLLVYALRDMSFWRLRIRDGRVVMTERFPFVERIREVVQGHAGELVVWSDERNIYFIRPMETGDALSGRALYRVCAGCHVAPAPGTAAFGPSLRGIVGRPVASRSEFEYSPAMSALGGIWTRKRLEAFIADPRAFVPGSSMTFAGIPDAKSREALLDYLEAPESRLDKMPPLPEW